MKRAFFEAGHYDKTMEWAQRALAEQPKAVTIHRLLAPACALAGDPDRTKHSILNLQLGKCFPRLEQGFLRPTNGRTNMLKKMAPHRRNGWGAKPPMRL
jgi:hypothetical protein